MTDLELTQRQQNMRRDPAFSPAYNYFFDLSEARLTNVSSETILELAEASPFREGSKGAILAPRDLEFGLSRMYEIQMDHAVADVRVFRTRQDANRFLGLQNADGEYDLALKPQR